MKFGLQFACQVIPDKGIPLDEPYRDMLECLPEAEDLGYESAFITSHHAQPDGWCPSPVVALAAAAAVTSKMRLGTGILLLPLYAPFKLAEDVATIDNISGGRFVLGVAPGYVSEEFEAHDINRDERFKRFEESLDLLQTAFSGEEFSFDGRFYQVPEARLTPAPVQDGGPPIWYGVSGPRSLRRAAERGCVVIGSPRHEVAELKEHFQIYGDAAAEVGYEIPERPIIREMFVAETQEEAERIAGPGVEYLFRELYGAKSAEGERELRTDSGELITDKSQVDFQSLRGRFVIGDPDHAIRELRRLEDEVGATEVLCWMHIPGVRGEDAARSMRLVAEAVMPAFAGTASASA